MEISIIIIIIIVIITWLWNITYEPNLKIIKLDTESTQTNTNYIILPSHVKPFLIIILTIIFYSNYV